MTSEKSSHLVRCLSLLDVTTIVVGTMIGSGVFLKASGIAQVLPDPSYVLLAWTVAGLVTILGALSLSELASMFPESGGAYRYLEEAYGPVMSFLFGWSLLAVMETGSIAGLAAGVTQVLAEPLHLSAMGQTWGAGALIVAVTLVNVRSTRVGAGIQNVFTLTKMAGILVLIGGGLLLAGARVANFAAGPIVPTGMGLGVAFAVVIVKTLWAYDGWVNATYLAGETRSPQTMLPRALIGGTVLVMALYLGVNAVYHLALPVEAVAASRSPAVAVAMKMGGMGGAVAMMLLAAISMTGTLNGSVMSGARVTYALGENRRFLTGLARVHPQWHTPHVALGVQCLWSIALLGLWQKFETITDNVIFVYWIFYALGAAAVIVLRRRRPELERPFRVPLYPLVPVTFVAVSLWLTLNTFLSSPVSSLQALVLLGIGLVLYPVCSRVAL